MKVTPECHHLLCAFNALGSQVRAPFALRLPFCRTGVDADIHVSWWYSKSFVKKKKKRWKTYQPTFRFWTPSTLSLKSPCVCSRFQPILCSVWEIRGLVQHAECHTVSMKITISQRKVRMIPTSGSVSMISVYFRIATFHLPSFKLASTRRHSTMISRFFL